MKTITVMREGRPATQEELEAAVNGDPLPPVRVNPLVRLWDARADTLEKCSRVVVNNKALREQLEAMASAYMQCAREFEMPPVELFEELGYEQPNTGLSGGTPSAGADCYAGGDR